MSYRVEITRYDDSRTLWAQVFIGSEPFPRFLIAPVLLGGLAGDVARVVEFRAERALERIVHIDAGGEILVSIDLLNGTQFLHATPGGEPGINYGWLLDVAQEAGMRFPALQGG
jgi:hypothetical protein